MANEGLTLVRDRWYTALTADVSSAATSLPVVTNTVGGNVLPTPCIIMCGFEQMYATASTATTITVTRGFNSTAAIHAKGATVGIARVAAHHNDVIAAVGSLQPSAITRKNYLDNGAFLLSQRGAGIAGVDNAYGPDRWRMVFNTGGATPPSYSTGAAAAAAAGMGRNQVTISAGTTGHKFGLFQVLKGESIWDLRGQAASLQIWHAGSIDAQDNRAGIVAWTGTEDAVSGDPVSNWNSAGTNPSLNSGWAFINTPTANMFTPIGAFLQFKLENVTIPSNVTNLGVLIWNDATTYTLGGVLIYSDIQLERGSVCTQYQRESLPGVYVRCAPYYCKTFDLTTTPTQNSGAYVGALAYRASAAGVSNGGAGWRFPLPMRHNAPTITTYSPGAATSAWFNGTDGAASGAASTDSLGQHGVFIVNAQAAGDGVGEKLAIHATASAEL